MSLQSCTPFVARADCNMYFPSSLNSIVIEQNSSGQSLIALHELFQIATAVTFLTNKDVMRHPINQKQQFLRSKGLSESEIQIACERAGIFPRGGGGGGSHTALDMGAFRPNGDAGLAVYQKPRSRFRQLLELINSLAAASGIVYCVYLLYKRFIKPLLFGPPKTLPPPKTLDESLREIESNMERRMDELSAELIRVRDDINKTSLQNIKSDLDAIKGLLLNKKQFASPIVPPSIPAWQLAAAASSHQEPEEDSRDKGPHDDNDTGSGSSETEIVTKNSDSSLEIM